MVCDKGFTLMELLTTIVIVAVLATIGVPSFVNSLQDNRLRAAGEQLYQQLYNARSTAINGQKNIFISFNSGSNWCLGLDSSNYCNCTSPSTCDLGTLSNSNNNVDLTITGLTNNQTQLSANRGMFAQSGTMTFSQKGKSVAVETSVMGRIRICSDSIVGFKPC